MTWQDNLKEVCGEEYLDSVEELITSLLKKHRDNILNQFTDMEGTIDIPLVISLIKSAPDE